MNIPRSTLPRVRPLSKLLTANVLINTTIVNPPFLYGRYVIQPGDGPDTRGSNNIIYQLIARESTLPPPSTVLYCNVRDAARAHLLALELPKLAPNANVRDKRFLVAAPTHESTSWPGMVQRLAARRPDLKHRLPKLDNAPTPPGTLSTNDSTRAREVLGLTEYVGWEETVDETIAALLQLEEKWKQNPRDTRDA